MFFPERDTNCSTSARAGTGTLRRPEAWTGPAHSPGAQLPSPTWRHGPWPMPASSAGATEGKWIAARGLPERWTIAHGPITLELNRTEFGHLGVFPEQVANWDWITAQVRPPRGRWAFEPLRVHGRQHAGRGCGGRGRWFTSMRRGTSSPGGGGRGSSAAWWMPPSAGLPRTP